jgi:hypothetical protein
MFEFACPAKTHLPLFPVGIRFSTVALNPERKLI